MGLGEGQNQSCPREEIKNIQARHTEDSGRLVESTKQSVKEIHGHKEGLQETGETNEARDTQS